MENEDLITSITPPAVFACGHLFLYSDRVEIENIGVDAKFRRAFFKGKKVILLKNITAVELREKNILNGYIQFTVAGGIERQGSILAAYRDENSVIIPFAKWNENARLVVEYVRKHISEGVYQNEKIGSNGKDVSTQLLQLLDLREKGVLSPEEFDRLKADLIS